MTRKLIYLIIIHTHYIISSQARLLCNKQLLQNEEQLVDNLQLSYRLVIGAAFTYFLLLYKKKSSLAQ